MKESIKFIFIESVGDNSLRGSIYVKYGIEIFSNNNIAEHQWIIRIGQGVNRFEMITEQCKELGITDYLITYLEQSSSNSNFFMNKS